MPETSTHQLKQHKIPYFVPTIGDDEVNEVVATLRSGWLTTGKKAKQFEEDFAQRVGAKHAIAVNSCTAALHLALEAHGIGPGDEVVVPSLTFASTAEVVIHLGGTPVLADCLPDTLNVDPESIAARITPNTKAIIPVHYGGRPCDLDAMHALAARHSLPVIEDAAHALPARYGDRTIGSISDVSCFSFYANKTITTGEGGMVTTDNDELAARMRIMSLHGISKDAWKRFSAEGSWYYEITAPGFKHNMTDLAASIGMHQLRRCDEFWEGRQRCADFYHQALSDVAEVELPPPDSRHQISWHLYVIQLDLDRLTIGRNEFITRLNEAGVGTSVHYLPLHMHPYYRDEHGYRPEDLPVAQRAFQRMISLPIYPKLTDDDLQHVAETVRSIVAEKRK